MALERQKEKEILAGLTALSGSKENWEAELDRIVLLLDYPSGKIRAKALWFLGEMGLRHPNKAEPHIPRIAGFISDEDEKIRERALGALGRIGRGRYELAAPYLDVMLERARDRAPLVRMNLIWAAENIAVNHPEAFENSMDLFASLLDDEAVRVRIEAPELFRVIGKRKPAMVEPYLDKLKAMAEGDENQVVRIHSAGAVKAAMKTKA
ncbi:HEAT repeat domain-containing protein [Breznakiella homolactica]|uniref:HEAT repeat domain-containing protein n=1 Tax=Breznakiella homolactica TaxID=2798577 RepID=A0A7T7XK24_9SPIR|nr:sister chromatid cohesion protein PDS5 [Breznakiella homolactica]QQO07854.1 sister chromatid cohesion protein PDS5 [Breznakiella homolactica]